VVAFLILWACFTALLGPMDLLVGWLPATPILVLLGVLTLGYGVLMGHSPLRSRVWHEKALGRAGAQTISN
jgi:hypothetical protein